MKVREAAQLALAAVQHNFGDKLSEEQEAVALAADITCEAYAIESALLRTAKLASARGEANCQTAIEMARTYANDAADRAASAARSLAAALDKPKSLDSAFDRLAPQRTINTVATRRHIADAMIEAGRYLW
jgi:hypothetical protein